MNFHVGIIGCGKMGRLHAAGYQAAGAVVKMVADADPKAARALAADLGCRWTADYGRLLDDRRITAVSVCVPTDLHFPILSAALQAGKHVLCEKPLTTHLSDARTLTELAFQAGVVVQVGYMKRFDPAVQAAYQALPEIGQVQSGQFRSYMPFPETRWNTAKQSWILDRSRSGGGALVHSGSHVLDIVQWFCGPVIEVAGHVRFRQDLLDTDYLAQAMLWTQSGAALFLEIGWLPLTGIGHRQDGWDEVFAVTGDQGRLAVRTNWWNQVDTSRTSLELYTESDRAKRLMTFGPPDHFNREVRAFVETIESDGQPLVGVQEGYDVQLIIEAIYRSARQGERVTVSAEAERLSLP